METVKRGPKTVESLSVSSGASFDASLQVTNELYRCPHVVIVQMCDLYHAVWKTFAWYYINNM